MHKLHLGDCLDIMPALPGQSVHMVLADLPYGTTACAWDAVIPFEPLWMEFKRLLEPGGTAVLTASQPFTSALVMSNLAWFRHDWIWEKDRPTGHVHASRRPMRAHEHVLVFAPEVPRYNPQKTFGQAPINKAGRNTKAPSIYRSSKVGAAGSTERYPRSVQQFCMPNHGEHAGHPTQKPLTLCEYLIRTYTDEGMTVLDPTMRSGTTGVACINTGRNFIGVERDPGYHAIAQRRCQEAAEHRASQLLPAA